MYQEEWKSRERDPKDLMKVAQLLAASNEARLAHPALLNFNQYLISMTLMNANMLGFETDISTLIVYTGIGNSSVYNALEKMEEKKLIEFYEKAGDKKRKYVRAKKALIDQHLDYFDVILTHLAAFTKNEDNEIQIPKVES